MENLKPIRQLPELKDNLNELKASLTENMILGAE